jgi:hypothetical protein
VVDPAVRRDATGYSPLLAVNAARFGGFMDTQGGRCDRGQALVGEAIGASVKTLLGDLRPPIPAQYYRQYVGTFLAGRRILYVTGLSKAMVDRRPRVFRWRSRAFVGCDFGAQAFGAAFDMNSQRFISFDFDH